MKNFILLFILSAPVITLAQSALMLPNGIDLPKVTTLTACTNTEKGRIVFNSSDSKAYYCNGLNWQEMTGGGFTLPYKESLNTASDLLYLENSDGRAIYGKATNNTAIKGESNSGYGVYGQSNSSTALYGTSTNGTGVVGISTSGVGIRAESNIYYAGYFEAYGSSPTLYVYSSQGEAANFRGNVKIQKELIVDDNKGIVRSNSSTQQKIVRTTGGFSVTGLGVGAYIDSGNLNYENFGGVPTVTVGQILNGSATGEWYKVMIIPINVTATGCQLRIVNLSSDTVTMTGTWHFLIVGPE